MAPARYDCCAMNFALLFLSLFAADSNSFIRTNQVGYIPGAPKIAVICSLDSTSFSTFEVRDSRNRRVHAGPAQATGSFASCRSTFRLDFSTVRREGTYRLIAGGIESRPVRIARDAYAGAADTLLYYMRQQRSGWNPLFQTWVHNKDAIIVDHPTRTGEYQDVQGGWADAADYLQYVATSAHATFMMLMAYRDNPHAFADKFDAWGRPVANGIADVLDEARHGLNWLAKMFPTDSGVTPLEAYTSTDPLKVLVFNQLADDRDHSFWDLPTTDSSDYGWGKGSWRPVYPCTGKPQGLFTGKNRSTGLASTAGKFASAFALGAALVRKRDPAFAARLQNKATLAFVVGQRFPGVCQTAPGRAAYFYEEDNWRDDMELAAAQLYALTGDVRYIHNAVTFAAAEPVTPWMGADTARHYQWFPWHNNGHYEIWRALGAQRVSPAPIPPRTVANRDDIIGPRTDVEGAGVADYYRRGLQAVVDRANNGFRVGIPFIWCSNNLMASFATQALLYRQMTGDEIFREYEVAALDWLLGVNPWGTSMIIGYPNGGVWAQKPHSVVADRLGVHTQLGGLLDGPVYRSIYQNLQWVRLHEPDEYARFNTDFIVYHDDLGDYSTNEPIMDGTANLSYLFAAMASK